MSSSADIVLAVPADLMEFVFPAAVRERLEGLGTVHTVPDPTDWSAPAAREFLERAEVLVTGWRTARLGPEELAAAQRLRAVVHSAGTVRFLVAPAAYDRGIVVSSQAATNARPVAEYTLGAILLSLKEAWRVSALYRADRGPVDRQVVMPRAGIAGKRVGLIGASTIGRMVIELLKPFDVEVSVYDPYLTEREAAGMGVTLVADLGGLMATSDLVSLHAPLLPATRGMITAELLTAMPDGATFVNTARGALVDQDALVRELSTGRIHAVVDVTDPEVPPAESPLWELDNVFLTPHIAGTVGTELPRLGHGAVDEVGRLLAGQPLQHEVTRAVYDRLA